MHVLFTLVVAWFVYIQAAVLSREAAALIGAAPVGVGIEVLLLYTSPQVCTGVGGN